MMDGNEDVGGGGGDGSDGKLFENMWDEWAARNTFSLGRPWEGT